MASMVPVRAQQDRFRLPQKLKRRRLPRATLACTMCRLRKVKCDQGKPKCAHCIRFRLECMYPPVTQYRKQALNSHVEQANTTTSSAPTVSGQFSSDPRENAESQARGLLQTSLARPEAAALRNPLAETGGTSPTPDNMSIAETPVHSRNHSFGEIYGVASDSVGEVNNYTTGVEFFGPTGTFPFLARLLARSQVSRQHEASIGTYGDKGSRGGRVGGLQSVLTTVRPATGEHLSIVNFLHNEDYPVFTRPLSPEHDSQHSRTQPQSLPTTSDLQSIPFNSQSRSHDNVQSSTSPMVPQGSANAGQVESSLTRHAHGMQDAGVIMNLRKDLSSKERKTQLERECIRLYFANLHVVHPILHKKIFLERCEKLVWSSNLQSLHKPLHQHQNSRFLALYNAVCAVGAITAGDESSLGDILISPLENLYPSSRKDQKSRMGGRRTYLPVRLARVFFEQAKLNLGDVFEICSLESTQALFLMSVFCQNALKPHSCYMYSGMAARTAFAIGITSEKAMGSLENKTAISNTWWCMYSHEIEMCCAAGRETFLKRPSHYNISLPPANQKMDLETGPTVIVGVMVSFADILRKASKKLYYTKGQLLEQISKSALELDEELQHWKNHLPPCLSLDTVSLQDPKWLSMQKVVLKLRFWNARIILHRQFLVASAVQDLNSFSEHLELCLDASRKTIHLLYDTYLQQCYFRTWWYNTTYTLYASMIILYLVLLNYNKSDAEALLKDVDKSLEILRSMATVHVANRCSQLISEVLEIAKIQVLRRGREPQSRGAFDALNPPSSTVIAGPSAIANPEPHSQSNYQEEPTLHEPAGGLFGDELLTSLIDFNLLGDFAGLGDMNAFHDAIGGGTQASEQYLREQSYSLAAQDGLHGGEEGVLFDISSDTELDIFGLMQGSLT